ncbi:MAG TPA: hypothetical protein VD758_13350 [Gemmatimonadaceae bacterium]|nr:hypothetical protein [Gemmatimonadaceae bacterium]
MLSALLVSFSANPLRIPAFVSVALVAMIVVISYADLQRRDEGTLLHNLGLPVRLVVAISALPAIVAESAIRIAQAVGG